MTCLNVYCCALSSLLLVGCASTGESPLIFGQSNTIGISIGASVADQGGDLILGYKGHNFAVVPVTVGQPDGASIQIGAAQGPGFSDAYSVLGQFEARAKSTTASQNAGLGTFFATGLAAAKLAGGFAQKMGEDQSTMSADCRSSASTAGQQSDQTAAQQPNVQAQASPQRDRSGSTPERRPNTSLVYGQYQSAGFIVSAAATQQGADLTLGYKDRNIAIVPAIKRDGSGVVSPVESSADGHYDALSVLGQFAISGGNDAGTVDVGLGKFFSTGAAAKKLSDGFAAKLCGEYVPPQNPGAQQPVAK